MDAVDFVPNEAKIDIEKAYFIDDVKNLADKEDIVENIQQSVSDYDLRFVSQREEWASEDTGIWNQADAAFRSFVNDSSVQVQKRWGANEPAEWERAKIGSTLYHRQVTQMAANGYAVQTSKEMPFKYVSLNDDSSSDSEQTDEQAKKLNLLAKWSMKKDKFNLMSIDFWTQIKKYGNIPVMVEWSHKKGRKTIRIPVIDPEDPTQILDHEIEEIDTIVENRPKVTLLPIASVKADTVIGNLQDQECVIVSSVVGLSSIVAGIRDGFYRKDMIKDLGTAQQWDGYSGFENAEEKKENRGFENKPSGLSTGQYLKREVFINVPISDKGKWDEDKNIPVRYRVTMFGNNSQNAVVARIERNQEPDDTIPISMIHANPDDSDLLYHISNFETLRPNLATETTLKRQVIDRNTLANKPPLKEVSGEVQGNDRTFGANARFVVDNKDSISEFNIQDLSQSTMALLDYVENDSNLASNIDKNMQGESFGARTSASEAGTISAHSQRPNLVNIEYILEQYLGFVASRYKILWETYGLKEQVVQITDEEDNTILIRPTDIDGDFDIVVDIMDDIKDDAIETTQMINYVQTVGSIEQLSQITDWEALGADLGEKILGTSKYVIGATDGDADDAARANLVQMIGDNGLPTEARFPSFRDGMNLRKHLDIYKSERLRWRGREDLNVNIEAVLDPVIEQLEARIQAPTQQQQGAQQAPVGETEMNRQQMSAATGGV